MALLFIFTQPKERRHISGVLTMQLWCVSSCGRACHHWHQSNLLKANDDTYLHQVERSCSDQNYNATRYTPTRANTKPAPTPQGPEDEGKEDFLFLFLIVLFVSHEQGHDHAPCCRDRRKACNGAANDNKGSQFNRVQAAHGFRHARDGGKQGREDNAQGRTKRGS